MAQRGVTRRRAIARATAAGLIAVGAVGATGGPTAVRADPPGRRRLIVGMSGFPPAVEPVLFNHTATRRVVPQLFDTLVAFDPARGMALRPALAERWERTGPRTVRLWLRKGVTFHDGSPFTADDVVFSLGPEHLLGPGMSGRSIAMQTMDRLDRVEAIDAHSIVIHAKGDDALLEQRPGDRRSSASAPSRRRAPGTNGRRRRSAPARIAWSARSLMSTSCWRPIRPIGAARRPLPASTIVSCRSRRRG
jgi:peptide/nickel transport system substrate-binding protein